MKITHLLLSIAAVAVAGAASDAGAQTTTTTTSSTNAVLLKDASGATLGRVVSTYALNPGTPTLGALKPAFVSILTGRGFLVTLSIGGGFPAPNLGSSPAGFPYTSGLLYTQAGCAGPAYVDHAAYGLNPNEPKVAASIGGGKFIATAGALVQASSYASINASGACSSSGGSAASTLVPVVVLSAADVGLPATITAPLTLY